MEDGIPLGDIAPIGMDGTVGTTPGIMIVGILVGTALGMILGITEDGMGITTIIIMEVVGMEVETISQEKDLPAFQEEKDLMHEAVITDLILAQEHLHNQEGKSEVHQALQIEAERTL